MKRILKLTLLIAIVTCGTGCTTGYWVDRGRDAADVLTATAGVGLGAKARVGPTQAGLMIQWDRVGMRGGTFPEVVDYNDIWIFPPTMDFQFLIWGGEGFDSHSNLTAERAKDFHAETYGLICYQVQDPEYPKKRCNSYYTQIEMVVALGASIRLGFNPGELLDLLLGFVGIDIYNDDLKQRKQLEIEQEDIDPDGQNP